VPVAGTGTAVAAAGCNNSCAAGSATRSGYAGHLTDRFPQRCFAFDQFGAVGDPPASRRRVGAAGSSGPAAGDLPP
jgi:hypothetical protein